MCPAEGSNFVLSYRDQAWVIIYVGSAKPGRKTPSVSGGTNPSHHSVQRDLHHSCPP